MTREVLEGIFNEALPGFSLKVTRGEIEMEDPMAEYVKHFENWEHECVRHLAYVSRVALKTGLFYGHYSNGTYEFRNNEIHENYLKLLKSNKTRFLNLYKFIYKNVCELTFIDLNDKNPISCDEVAELVFHPMNVENFTNMEYALSALILQLNKTIEEPNIKIFTVVEKRRGFTLRRGNERFKNATPMPI